MSARAQRITRTDVTTRATHARAFVAAAELIETLADDAGIESKANLIGSLAVLAGIAASDAICGAAVGERTAGENHLEAVTVLRRATPPSRLLSMSETSSSSPSVNSETWK
ncbi:hypothetical protein [Agromyces larvae]|uniref:Uncharacterized protein n=1 Tax=Agromyces larvae TaxID=2929802 RepID=A0ABY4C2A6_9MICO|nr:hypothetical protein [Agromyces larvae]UOE42910.1 hypothetical protein MTO99_12000 [Agromyces larvae]